MKYLAAFAAEILILEALIWGAISAVWRITCWKVRRNAKR